MLVQTGNFVPGPCGCDVTLQGAVQGDQRRGTFTRGNTGPFKVTMDPSGQFWSGTIAGDQFWCGWRHGHSEPPQCHLLGQ